MERHDITFNFGVEIPLSENEDGDEETNVDVNHSCTLSDFKVMLYFMFSFFIVKYRFVYQQVHI